MISKTGLIITGGAVNTAFAREFMKNRQYDVIIAADAGLKVLDRIGVRPDTVVGDLDTADPQLVGRYRLDGDIEFEIHPPEKDETDTELAVTKAVKMGCGRVDILGALGGRIDHELANIQLLLVCREIGLQAYLIDERNRIHLTYPGERFRKEELYGKYISFIPLTEEVKGLTLRGFRYPLEHRDVKMGPSRLISNEVEEEGLILFEEGNLLCVESHD
ncbi:MAG: thiamine diphosphokinase [Clostridium sp.]|nr:thiamine diphosphokinase [Clostridium sp.]